MNTTADARARLLSTEAIEARLGALAQRPVSVAAVARGDTVTQSSSSSLRDRVLAYVRQRDGSVRNALVNAPLLLLAGGTAGGISLKELQTLQVSAAELVTPAPAGCGCTLRELVDEGVAPTLGDLFSLRVKLTDLLSDASPALAPRALADVYGLDAVRTAVSEHAPELGRLTPEVIIAFVPQLGPRDFAALGVRLGVWLHKKKSFAEAFRPLAPAVLSKASPLAWREVGLTGATMTRDLRLGKTVGDLARRVQGWTEKDVAAAFSQ